MDSPILDLAGITLEVNHLPRGVRFYTHLFGLDVTRHDDDKGVAEFRVNDSQHLTLWKPITRRKNDERLGKLRARGASHLHFAWQVREADLDGCKAILDAYDVPWTEIDLGTQERPDPTLYFYDPFGHGLELRGVNLDDERQPTFPPKPTTRPPHALPVLGLREAAIGFSDYDAMKERLPRAYGFCFVKEQEDRDFAQFVLSPRPESDGNGTPQRWLYCWDPQIGLADMHGGDHATLKFYADVDAVARRVAQAGLEHGHDDLGLVVRDPEGHVFEFVHP